MQLAVVELALVISRIQQLFFPRIFGGLNLQHPSLIEGRVGYRLLTVEEGSVGFDNFSADRRVECTHSLDGFDLSELLFEVNFIAFGREFDINQFTEVAGREFCDSDGDDAAFAFVGPLVAGKVKAIFGYF